MSNRRRLPFQNFPWKIKGGINTSNWLWLKVMSLSSKAVSLCPATLSLLWHVASAHLESDVPVWSYKYLWGARIFFTSLWVRSTWVWCVSLCSFSSKGRPAFLLGRQALPHFLWAWTWVWHSRSSFSLWSDYKDYLPFLCSFLETYLYAHRFCYHHEGNAVFCCFWNPDIDQKILSSN